MPPRRPLLLLAVLLGLLTLCPAQTGEPLRTARQVLHSTEADHKARPPVVLRGVVTSAEPDWEGRFFLQDHTGGVFVEYLQTPGPRVGDLLEVRGTLSRGAFTPIVIKAGIQRLGTAPLPEPYKVGIEELTSGNQDAQRVEIEGWVRASRPKGSRRQVDLVVAGRRIHVLTHLPADLPPDSLVAARVRVRGTVAASFNSRLKHLTGVNIFVPSPADFVIEEVEQSNPFNEPPLPIMQVAQFHPENKPGRRIHVSGIITGGRPGLDLFVQDSSGGIQVQGTQLPSLKPGTSVDIAGFLEYENNLPVIKDGIARVSREAFPPVVPVEPEAARILQGLHPFQSITLRGHVIDVATRNVNRELQGFVGKRVTWMIQGDSLTFPVEIELPHGVPVPEAPAGSLVAATGVLLPDSDGEGHVRDIMLVLPALDNLRLLEAPSWFTPARLAIAFGVACLVLIGVAAWSVTVSRKNEVLKFLISDREAARAELQEAHDQLERRVEERSRQLEKEIRERETDEVEFKAVLAERTRLAQELHDTLEQTLTGIALQLDTAWRFRDPAREEAVKPLELARTWIRQSQLELRRSIWDLRSRELEQFELSKALEQSAHAAAESSGITITQRTEGTPLHLPETVEENLLRIGQEALANLCRHSAARTGVVVLSYGERELSLSVSDDGKGLPTSGIPGKDEGHFGLIGMSERAQRLGGKLEISSHPGEGMRVTVRIPLESIVPRAGAATLVI